MTRPVDAAVAFANLYQRWFDDAHGLVEANRLQAQAAVGLYVADVLALWDGGSRSYLAGAPAILRLETCDLAVFAMRGPHIALFAGSVETDAPVATFETGTWASRAAAPPALRWESLRPCSYAIGRKVEDIALRTDADGLLVGIEAVLDDGGRIAIGDVQAAEAPADGLDELDGRGARTLPRAV